MNFFWVNIGASHKEVVKGKFLWAPSYAIGKKNQRISNAGWNTVPTVKSGDVIFCHLDGFLIYVGVASADAYPAQRPATRTYDGWQNDGCQIDVNLTILLPQVDITQFKSVLIDIHNEYCTPALFTKIDTLSQQYMIALPQGAGALIMSCLGDAEIKVDESVAEKTRKKKLEKGGVREAKSYARIGQGQFREDVLSLWNNTCPVTGVSKIDMLTASHVVPWSISTDEEKIDPHNGFPFSPAIDRLFDRGYISFGAKGEMLVKPAITKQELQKLGVPYPMSVTPLNSQQLAYLARHRTLFHF